MDQDAVTSRLEEQAEAFGIVDAIPAIRRRQAARQRQARPAAFEVWPENWPTVQAFLRCAGYWRLGDAGYYLDPVGIDLFLRRGGLDDPDKIYAGLLLMESAAVPVLNDRLKQQREAAYRG